MILTQPCTSACDLKQHLPSGLSELRSSNHAHHTACEETNDLLLCRVWVHQGRKSWLGGGSWGRCLVYDHSSHNCFVPLCTPAPCWQQEATKGKPCCFAIRPFACQPVALSSLHLMEKIIIKCVARQVSAWTLSNSLASQAIHCMACPMASSHLCWFVASTPHGVIVVKAQRMVLAACCLSNSAHCLFCSFTLLCARQRCACRHPLLCPTPRIQISKIQTRMIQIQIGQSGSADCCDIHSLISVSEFVPRHQRHCLEDRCSGLGADVPAQVDLPPALDKTHSILLLGAGGKRSMPQA